MENSFSEVSRLFSHIGQSVLVLILQGCFKKVGIQFYLNNVLRNQDEDVLLSLLQIWKTRMLMFLWLCFLPPHFGIEESNNNSELRKQQYWDDKKNNIHEEWN